MERVNPATEAVLDPIDEHTDTAIEAAIDRSVDTYETWRDRSLSQRRRLLAAAGDELRENTMEYAEIATREMGKPITEAIAEIEKCAWVCDHYAEQADSYLADEVIRSEPHAKTFVSHEPIGPVLAVMPWNYPFWQVFRFAAPALTAGNTGLLKHASNVPGCAKAIERVFERAGYPRGVFQSLIVGSDAIEGIIEDDRIRGVTLTGSERAGRAVGGAAGRELLPSVLELGGSDPFIVLDDADVETAARVGTRARTLNSGQSCIAAKRFIVHEAVYDAFVDAFITEIESLSIGDPTDESTDIGPQARKDLMDDVHEQIQQTLRAGGTLETGGEPLDREGYFYPPTVVTDVPHDSPMGREEVFGPAAAVFSVPDEDTAVEVANDSTYGLGGSIWTEDLDRGEQLARRIESGCVFVNELTKSDPRLPFGGVKQSGYGRELSEHGIKSFVNEKTVWVQSADAQE
ncbi:NAD-dependent succinate-semialdehyde dehydrogenase [Halocatena salina]|uniref:NAD-dependent succinate-semialdehyde dehydrogenase n=1 Tax=Halocatena salina TaxID=2934340 RepID=A0A8U0A292_9EURY|nr:NAD-dependent succinate-semialdehyde dehydrogenase [Halocatena salina]UPM42558.1 NAD-dependent succinate-semialdehyde dehydrogenase [Halocatena salina]